MKFDRCSRTGLTGRAIVSAVAVLLLLFLGCGYGCAQTTVDKKVTDQLASSYPRLKLDSIRSAPVDGLYELQSGNNILYYYPEKDYLVFGEIWNKDGKSLTAERRQEVVAKNVKSLPLDKALVLDNGKNTVIQFTDPDCPYCRKVFSYLETVPDTKQYVFFLPLPMHKNAEPKVKHILCSKDKAQAFREAMSGGLDNKPLNTCQDQAVTALVEEHKALAQKIGVNGTPFLVINGVVINGANIPQIQKLLPQKGGDK